MFTNFQRVKEKQHHFIKLEIHSQSGQKKSFSRSDTANWSYEFFTTTEINSGPIPVYHEFNVGKNKGSPREHAPEKYIEALPKKFKLTMNKYEKIWRQLCFHIIWKGHWQTLLIDTKKLSTEEQNQLLPHQVELRSWNQILIF